MTAAPERLLDVAESVRTDLYTKPDLDAVAGIPVYVIADRKHNEVVVLSDPLNGEYRSRAVYRKGQTFTLPESIGAKVEMDVDSLLLT
ncbi:Uma2 family endonuclease [Streptomyces silvisoli]|uniref:Uma2 family endonuclease n=1 Tax=Streptomyces silvisoli TaxID=3034235 RepID=A0ABT5ZTG6_9ACTN|nr:Uma2 family endonuclease [Streptomyces silvisoli]MDF3293129.1 Uma2 family endonuclease [Streptomyces silvisoli]